ncbi:hypothetical protein HQ544_03180 [Candidatus Falkowbacteria bacterium]|nr:hypothetical protein [Candidatus Falkowbacteria bacterium]
MRKLVPLLLLSVFFASQAEARKPDVKIGPFYEGSRNFDQLYPSAEADVDRVIRKMGNDPDLCVEMQAHSSSRGYLKNDGRYEKDQSRADTRVSSLEQKLRRAGIASTRIYIRPSVIRAAESEVWVWYYKRSRPRSVARGASASEFRALKRQVQGFVSREELEDELDRLRKSRRRPAPSPSRKEDKENSSIYFFSGGLVVLKLDRASIAAPGLGLCLGLTDNWAFYLKAGLDPVTDPDQWDGLFALGFRWKFASHLALLAGGRWASEFYEPSHELGSKYFQETIGPELALEFSLWRLQIEAGPYCPRYDHIWHGKKWRLAWHGAAKFVLARF